MTAKIFAIFGFAMLLSACGEEPRLSPGYQPAPLTLQNELADQRPISALSNEERQQKYEKLLNGKICYFAKVIDQDSNPVSDALVLVAIGRIGMGGSKEWRYYTHTDADGKFSVVGGESTRWSFSVFKMGFTPLGRSGEVKGPDALISLPDAPQTIILWRNTGFDSKKLINYSLKRIRVNWPAPATVKLNLIDGSIAGDDQDWDVEVGLGYSAEGDTKKLSTDWMVSFRDHAFFTANDGSLNFLADPQSGQSPIKNFVDFRIFGGVVPGSQSGPVPFFKKSENHYFQFKSRGGRVFGMMEINFGFGSETNPWIDLILNGAVNATGSPALFEREPTDEQMSTEGFEKSK